MRINIKIGIGNTKSTHCKTFHFNVEVRRFTGLGQLLHQIAGIKNHGPNSFPTGMHHKDAYEFCLQKDTRYSWDELLPKIQEIIRNYFSKPVEFYKHEALKKSSYYAFAAMKGSNQRSKSLNY